MTVFLFFIVITSAFYPQKAGISQVKTNTIPQKKVQKMPQAADLVNPKDKLADQIAIENNKERIKAEGLQNAVIKKLKKEAQKEAKVKVKIVYKTIYKKTIDTVFIPVPAGSVYNPTDSNSYGIKECKTCKTDTVVIRKKGWIQRLFNW